MPGHHVIDVPRGNQAEARSGPLDGSGVGENGRQELGGERKAVEQRGQHGSINLDVSRETHVSRETSYEHERKGGGSMPA
jgi:hypothetical protein